jgi:fructose-bisphosphate aldolase, class II
MGAKDVLTRKTGVIVGDDVLNLFKYAKEKGFAIPAIVSDSSFFRFLSTDRSRTLPHHRPW